MRVQARAFGKKGLLTARRAGSAAIPLPLLTTSPADAMDKILSKGGHYLGTITGTGQVTKRKISILQLLTEMHVSFHLLCQGCF